MSTLDIQHLHVSYRGAEGAVRALADFSIHVPEGRLTVLLGESGCGKSTALNAVAGLARPDRGLIRIGDRTVFQRDAGGRIEVAPEGRDIGMVFQSYALWPHLSVLENVAYPLRRRGQHQQAESLATQALALVRCEALAHRLPGELSGGQQQRVALARAIVARPRLLLFDEPLSNLDAGLRRSLRDELGRLHRHLGFTGIYVTHDQSEALALGTDVAVMDQGRILQSGTPEEIYERPRSEFVARFFGANITPARILSRSGTGARLDTAFGQFDCARIHGEGTEGVLAFMPQAVEVIVDEHGPLEVAAVAYLGSHREIRLIAKGVELLALHPGRNPVLAPGARASVCIAPHHLHAFMT